MAINLSLSLLQGHINMNESMAVNLPRVAGYVTITLLVIVQFTNSSVITSHSLLLHIAALGSLMVSL